MIYLDYASTTPIRKEVLETYTKLLLSYYGNSDSLHDTGRETMKLMEQSRANIAQLFRVSKDEIMFTSCATEANNYAVKAYAWANANRGRHIITTVAEHSSIANALSQLEKVFHFEVTYLPLTKEGTILLSDVKAAIRPDTILVSIMLVNNETGAINPIKQCADYVHKHSRAAFHMDGVQALGKIPVDLSQIDMASFSAHKLYGLKGSGLLVKKKHIQLLPLISGGQQENGLRAGTSNAPVNIVLAKTIRLALLEQEEHYQYVNDLNQYIRDECSKIEEIKINSPSDASPYICNISCDCITSEVMLNALNNKGIAVSAQSTCASKSKAMSHVLLAMGLGEHRASHAIRISLSHLTSLEECKTLLQALKEVIHDYRTK